MLYEAWSLHVIEKILCVTRRALIASWMVVVGSGWTLHGVAAILLGAHFIIIPIYCTLRFVWASHLALMVKNLPANAGDARDMCLIPGSERFPRVGNSNTLQDSCLENAMDREAWWVTVHGDTKRWTQLSVHRLACTHTHTHTFDAFSDVILYNKKIF